MPLKYNRILQNKIEASVEKGLTATCRGPCSSAPCKCSWLMANYTSLENTASSINKQTIKYGWPILSIKISRRQFRQTRSSRFLPNNPYVHWILLCLDGHQQSDFTDLSTSFGSPKELRMEWGLVGSPKTFRTLMEESLVGLTLKSYVPYLNDCIIFSRTTVEQISILREVFQCFHKAEHKTGLTNCFSFQTKVPFLGHMFSKDGLQVDPEKIKVERMVPLLKHQTEVKSLLGLASYYRRCVFNFTAIARLLYSASEMFRFSPETDSPGRFWIAETPPMDDTHFDPSISPAAFPFGYQSKPFCRGCCSRSNTTWSGFILF